MASASASAFPTSAYVFLGHGSDTGNYNSRQTVPPGYTFVTAAQCGNVTHGSIHILFRRLQALGDKIYDPITYRKEVEDALKIKIHVYRQGDKLPELNIAFPATILEESEVKYYPSGVFKLPYPYTFDDIQKTQTADATAFLEKLFFSEGNLLKNKMKADIPKQFENVKHMANIPSMINKLKIRYPLKDLLKGRPASGQPWLPHGVYYHFLCRAYQPVPGKHGINEKILRTRRMSVEQQYAQMEKPVPAYNIKPFVLVKRYYDGNDKEDGYDTIEEAYKAYTDTIAEFKVYDVKAFETVRTAISTAHIFEDKIIQPLKIPYQIVIIKRQAAKGGKRKTRKQKKTKRCGTRQHRKN